MNILTTLDDLLQKSFLKIPKSEKIGVLFSGGVDSSTIAKYAQDNNLNPQLFTFGTRYSKDKEYAQNLARDLSLDFNYLYLDTNLIQIAIPKVKARLEKINIDPNIMQISLGIGFFEIAKLAKEKGITLFLSGQGSDELFGGYNKYLKLKDDDLALQMKKDTDNLFKVDVIRDRVMAGIPIYFPYLDNDFKNFSLELPIGLKIKDGERKWILRELAKKRGLPEYIFTRPKNALQYSSGIQKIVEKLIGKSVL